MFYRPREGRLEAQGKWNRKSQENSLFVRIDFWVAPVLVTRPGLKYAPQTQGGQLLLLFHFQMICGPRVTKQLRSPVSHVKALSFHIHSGISSLTISPDPFYQRVGCSLPGTLETFCCLWRRSNREAWIQCFLHSSFAFNLEPFLTSTGEVATLYVENMGFGVKQTTPNPASVTYKLCDHGHMTTLTSCNFCENLMRPFM